ncbi:unnamed protein product [Pocillopora meandrina]|uniref:Ig-like domain-containing protein n=1 Tax=Pocillopora meandrina TaxID=46732 RepID=A0AAU9W1L7_9CNID|nr:unnamed protein product [Pocillopora meandrina]
MKCSELNDVRCQGIPYEVYEEIKEHKFGGKSARTIKVLKIRSALYSRDQGEFECIATNGHAQPAKLIIDLNVLEPLSFLVKPDVILHGYQAHSLTLNCSTNDRNATVSLYHRHRPLAPFRERKIDAKKVFLKGQVFTLLNLSLKVQGTYACEAKTEENESIRWPSTRGYLIVSQARIPDYFELKPANPIIVPKGGSTIVTCESEGVSEIQLQRKKGDVSNGNASIQDRMVGIGPPTECKLSSGLRTLKWRTVESTSVC